MNVQEYHLSDIGKIRKNNEDFVLKADTPLGFAYVLCDGMGGHAGGAIAAQLCAQTIIQTLQQTSEKEVEKAILSAINHANEVIHTCANTEPALRGMGTTCVVAVIQDKFLYFSHVGDSRLYQYHNQQLTQLTKDHSYVQSLIDQGKIQPSDADTHPQKHQLTAAVGTNITISVDIQVQKIPLTDKSLFLLCSDGLHGIVSSKIIQGTLEENQNKPLDIIAQKLIDLANDFGGLDNTTVQLLYVSAQNEPVISKTEQNHSENKVKTPLIDPPVEITQSNIPTTQQKPKYTVQLSSNQKLGLVVITLIATLITLFVAFYKNREKPEGDNFLTQLRDTLPRKDSSTAKQTTFVDTNQTKSTKVEDKTVNTSEPIDYEYYVQKGDILSKIAKKFNVKVEDIKTWNSDAKKKGHPKFPDLNAEAPLIIKIKAKHTVEQGETLSSIAEKYYGNVNQKRLITKANNINEDTPLKKGKILIIPQE